MFRVSVSSICNIICSFCIISGSFSFISSDHTYGQSANEDQAGIYRSYQKPLQSSVQSAAVRERSRPEYAPLGVRYRSFIILPFLTSGINFDSNINSSKNARPDFILRNKAGMHIESDWGRHLLNLHMSVEDYRYFEYHEENRTDIKAELENRLDFSSDFNVSNSATLFHGHESRDQGENQPGITSEPTAYTFMALSSALNYTSPFGRSRIKGSLEYYDYHDVSAVSGGNIEQDHRDSTQYQLALYQSYNLKPGYELFGELAGNIKNLKNIAAYPNRDSQGYRINAGLRFEVLEMMEGSISIGKQVQNFSGTDIEDISALSLYTSLLWNPTRLITVNMNMQREITDTQYLNASGKILTKFSTELSYEILRNIIGSLKAEYLLEEYRGISRDDRSLSAEINFEYLIDNRYSLDGYVRYKGRDSNLDNFDFDKTVIGTNIKLKF